MKRVVWGSVAFGLAAALGAGIPAAGAAPAPLVFMLDWFPNPDHVPLFAAQQEGWFTQEGLRVTLQIPANTDDPLKLAAAGRVDVAVNYEPNVIIARAQGLPVRSIGVLVGQPLITVMFLKSSGIRSPRDLVGRRVGFAVTGFADAMVDPFEYFVLRDRDGLLKKEFPQPLGKVSYHIPCHSRVQNVG